MPRDRKTNPAGENHSHHATKYRFEQALGDLIDNSIDAGATEIYISLADQDYTLAGSKKGQGVNEINYPKGLGYLSGKQLFCLLLDNGNGMTLSEMDDALIYGQRRIYQDYELGQYGVGLKNSTMSQAYEATILSKKNNKINSLRISSVPIQGTGKDQLLEENDFTKLYPWMSKTEGYSMAIKDLEPFSSGTAILLEGMHKIEREIGSIEDRDDYIDKIIKKAKAFIGLTFHKYISDKSKVRRTNGKIKTIPKLKIFFNGAPIEPSDPFFTDFTSSENNHWTLKRNYQQKPH